jgi:hypothetical protein
MARSIAKGRLSVIGILSPICFYRKGQGKRSLPLIYSPRPQRTAEGVSSIKHVQMSYPSTTAQGEDQLTYTCVGLPHEPSSYSLISRESLSCLLHFERNHFVISSFPCVPRGYKGRPRRNSPHV